MKTALAIVSLLSAAPLSAAAPQRDEAVLASYGAALIEDADGLSAAGAWTGSPAGIAGMKEGDRVLFASGAQGRTRAATAAGLSATAPEMREFLVVRRGLEPLALVGEPTPAPADFVRGARDLSAREEALARTRADRSSALARDAVAAAPPLDWSLHADQALWVRFQDGLPTELRTGEIVLAEAAAALTTDGSLDFLGVPSKSRLWARVISSSDDGMVRTLRLAFYKLQPAAGGIYPILGTATALAGVAAADLAQVSAGGTLVVAAPLPDATGKKRRGRDLLLDEDARLRVRLLEPVTIVEPPSWWRAGPGLWIKTSEKDGRRRFEVTHSVAGRSAAAAGLKPGDILDAVAGRSSEKLDFTDALDLLYGEPGSAVKVSVLRGGKAEELTLARGVKFEKGAPAPLPLPFEIR